MIMYPLFWFSLLVFSCMNALDSRCGKAKPGSMTKTIDSVLFSSYHRAMIVYFVSGLGVLIEIIVITYSGFLTEPLLFIGAYLVVFSAFALVSVFYAKHRDRGR